jgi:hypothetical protein
MFSVGQARSSYLLILAGVVLTAAAILILPTLLAASPSPEPTALPSLVADPHRVEVNGVSYVIAYDGGSIVVTRDSPPPADELGRVSIPRDAQPAASGLPLAGSAEWVLVCSGRGGGPALRIWWGHLRPESRSPIYSGPAAVGQAAPDGLFMFVLTGESVSDSDQLLLRGDTAKLGVGGVVFSDAAQNGEVMPSGCRLGT